MPDLMIILGCSASGKTTLARRLAAELQLPVLGKDDVKEGLFEVLGTGDRVHSRHLSDASFAVLLRMARIQLEAGLSCVLEGNWRPEHAAAVRAAADAADARVAQVGCSARPEELERRFLARHRHPGHLDEAQSGIDVQRAGQQSPSFLDLTGPRWTYDSERLASYAELLGEVERWRV
jgi:predicted kinase